MKSQHAVELCTLLIEDNFGELFARIFSTLQRYERLTLPRLRFYSALSERQLRHGLTAMIQQHLVFHFTSIDDGNTYYEANPEAAYYLVRSGKILQLVEERLGEYAAKVMEVIMFLGHASVRHLQSIPELQTVGVPAAPKPAVQTNGVSHGEGDDAENNDVENNDVENNEMEVEEEEEAAHETNGDDMPEARPAPFHSTLKALASHGYILRVKDAIFQSPSDNYLDARRTVSAKSDIKALKGKKQEEAIEIATAELVNERCDYDLSAKFMYNGLPRGVKRKFANGSGASNKQARTNGVNGHHADDEDEEENDWSEDEDGFDNIPMESGLIVRVNYEKLDVALRNVRFVDLAEQDAPDATVEVYETLLRRIEYATPRCRTDGRKKDIPREGEEGKTHSIPIEVMKIVNDLDPDLDLTGAIGPVEPQSSTTLNTRGKRPLENGANGTHDDEDRNSIFTRMTESHTTEGIKWYISFRDLARKLRHLELERMIESRYGDVALRVIRVLQAKGKLDEKRLQEISLLPMKDLRQTLATMQKGGFVDLQEVPKDAQRQPSKTIFLWYYDTDRLCSSILEDTYKAMSRTLQRIKTERGRVRDFLEKTERTDVKGHEEHYLTEGELVDLQRWRDLEALLLTEVARLDDMVAVFRDY
ncbi:hypothetical protein N7533_001833 [Penicillium manginii]|uniref:uncharacterized protein n=1 Tax=Penicillium manginii TaxID=203109 RepID=UPI0025489316|nr:uncharacterized protein N7533_001833 [Penicillium manginii]KAJ5763152.1 hypothetical protein N7533_001833 [Penicillium manginii]